jgi:hypothetical protein
MAIIVAAAALEVEVDAAEEVPLPAVAVAVGEVELELVVVRTAVKFAGLRCPQFCCSFSLQTFWAAWSFWPAVIQLE